MTRRPEEGSVRKLRGRRPKGEQLSLREVAKELAARRFLNGRGLPGFSWWRNGGNEQSALEGVHGLSLTAGAIARQKPTPQVLFQHSQAVIPVYAIAAPGPKPTPSRGFVPGELSCSFTA